MLPEKLPRPFHTGHLAEGLSVQRWIAQRMAYCLRHPGAIQQVGGESPQQVGGYLKVLSERFQLV